MVCHDGNGTQQCGVCVLSLRGTVLTMIDPRHTVATPAWSPDGKYLVYARRNGARVDGKDGYSLFAAAPDGSGHPIRLTTDPTIDLLPTVSPVHPHGRYQIAFQRRARGKPNQIWLVTVTAGEPTRIGTPQALAANDPRHPNHDPTWSPSGDKLAFSRNGTLVQTDPMSSSSSYQRLFSGESPHSDYKAVWASR
jgi:Tol biopolymer transport system component